MWGGRIAAIASFLFVAGIDYLFIGPPFTLGIDDWRGLIELALGTVLAMGFGITVSRVFPSPISNPSHA
jgi:hypothetical protein